MNNIDTSDVPEIGRIYTEEHIDINFRNIKNNSVKLVSTETDKDGNKLYKVELK